MRLNMITKYIIVDYLQRNIDAQKTKNRMGKWKMSVTTINQVTHGVMNVQFAANGFTAEEFSAKFSDALTQQMNIVMESLTGEKCTLEIFGHDIQQVATFEDEEF